MINTVLIDDERPALRELEYFLQAYPEVSILETFTNPLKAIEKIQYLQPDLVFLDINMPQMLGIDAASRILDSCEKVDIVFVTAYDKYAINAFEIHALDYLLKPLSEDRFGITIKRVLKKIGTKEVPPLKTLYIECLGRFQVGWAGEEPIKWRTEKTRELFAFLLHYRNRNVSKEELLDKLWPEDDPEKAIRQLYNGIYYIRKALEEYGIDRNLINIDSNYNLKLGTVDLDVERFNKFEQSNHNESIEELEGLEAIYQGAYFDGEYYCWAEIERENLIKIHEKCLIKLSEQYLTRGQLDKAEKKLQKAFRENPYEETITELLLRVYKETGDKSKAVRHFNSYEKLIKEDLGIGPNGNLFELYQALKL